MKVKSWIKRDKTSLCRILRILGVGTPHDLMRASLFVHISYGGKHAGGQSFLIRVQEVHIRESTITFEFRPPIIVDFDGSSGTDEYLGGRLDGVKNSAQIRIETLWYHIARGWGANFNVDECREPDGEILRDVYDELRAENLAVEVITHDYKLK